MNQLISIIVPVYNAGSTLDRCIQSLIAQTHCEIEIILVNDGSRDNSLELCHRFAAEDARIKVIDKPNGGVSSARNAGLDIATGEFIMFCDSDDWVEPDWCETMLSHYSPGNLVMCGYYCHFQDGKVTPNSSVAKLYPKVQYLQLLHLGAFAPWNKIFSAATIRANNLRFPPDISLGEDKLFIWRYLKHIAGHISYIGMPLNHYYFSSGSSLSATAPKEYFKQCFSISGEILGDIHSGVSCSPAAFQAFCRDMYHEYEKAIKQTLDAPTLSILEKKALCQKIMNHCDVKEITRASDSIKASLIGRFIMHQNFWGLYLLTQLKKF